MGLRKTYLPGIGRRARLTLGWNKEYLEDLGQRGINVRQANQKSKIDRKKTAHTIFTDIREIHNALTELDSTRTNEKRPALIEQQRKQIETYSNLQIKLFQALTKISQLSSKATYNSFDAINKYAKATREALCNLVGDTKAKPKYSRPCESLTVLLDRIINSDFEIIGT